MNSNFYFLISLSAFLAAVLTAGFIFLPRERFQFLAAIPLLKNKKSGHFHSRNLTWYGLITAFSVAVSTAFFCTLASAYGFKLLTCLIFAGSILAIALPASKIIAFIVEKRKGTITVGGAAFAAVTAAPFSAYAALKISGDGNIESILPLLAAIGCSYLIGEGIGRLSCLSFGCCYGKPLKKYSKPVKALLSPFAVRFYGNLKKASYESGYEGKKLFPIQNITAVIYSVSALVSAWIFLAGHFKISFLLSIITAFAWRIISEFFRADFRGFGKISSYQVMSFLSVIICAAAAYFLPSPDVITVNVSNGLIIFSDVIFVIVLQFLFAAVFLYTGISSVTASEIHFYRKK
ncbi:MAG TPA: prolipoprotein diacylglyceryl transferase [Spirochaetota bacterium]|nr:prolipoprotein diacylglyceryl transferase [Spirochaetota bacterium]